MQDAVINGSDTGALATTNRVNLNNAVMLSFLALNIYIMLGTSAFAGSTPMGNVLCTIVIMILGNLGRGLACCAIAIVGIGAMLGKVSWGLAATVGVGIAVTFGCASLASTLIQAAGGALACCPNVTC